VASTGRAPAAARSKTSVGVLRGDPAADAVSSGVSQMVSPPGAGCTRDGARSTRTAARRRSPDPVSKGGFQRLRCRVSTFGAFDPRIRLAIGQIYCARINQQCSLSEEHVLGDVRIGSRPAYRRLPLAGPLCGLQRSKRGRMSGLSPISVVLRRCSAGRAPRPR
jgi:hypothetical protein